jgi:hypothetical protein
MADIMTFQNIGLSFWDTLYIYIVENNNHFNVNNMENTETKEWYEWPFWWVILLRCQYVDYIISMVG